MKKLCFVICSPKGKNSTSKLIADEISKGIDPDKFKSNYIFISNNFENYDEIFNTINNADIIFFSFPLYVDSLPSHMLNFLFEYEKFVKDNLRSSSIPPKVYAISNCGFLEGTQNKHALNIIENFCDKVNFNWMYGLGIGAGAFAIGPEGINEKSKIKKPIYTAINTLIEDINNCNNNSNKYVHPRMLKSLFMLVGNRSFTKVGRQLGLSKKELYKRPYAK